MPLLLASDLNQNQHHCLTRTSFVHHFCLVLFNSILLLLLLATLFGSIGFFQCSDDQTGWSSEDTSERLVGCLASRANFSSMRQSRFGCF